jgi:hypothetical protein
VGKGGSTKTVTVPANATTKTIKVPEDGKQIKITVYNTYSSKAVMRVVVEDIPKPDMGLPDIGPDQGPDTYLQKTCSGVFNTQSPKDVFIRDVTNDVGGYDLTYIKPTVAGKISFKIGCKYDGEYLRTANIKPFGISTVDMPDDGKKIEFNVTSQSSTVVIMDVTVKKL